MNSFKENNDPFKIYKKTFDTDKCQPYILQTNRSMYDNENNKVNVSINVNVKLIYHSLIFHIKSLFHDVHVHSRNLQNFPH